MTTSPAQNGAPITAEVMSPGRTADPPVVSSSDLLAGGRELVIRHGAESYRLLITSQNKLILTK